MAKVCCHTQTNNALDGGTEHTPYAFYSRHPQGGTRPAAALVRVEAPQRSRPQCTSCDGLGVAPQNDFHAHPVALADAILENRETRLLGQRVQAFTTKIVKVFKSIPIWFAIFRISERICPLK